VHAVPAVYSSAGCPWLVNSTQALFIRMATILELDHSLFCELCSQFECPCVAAHGRGFLLLPVLDFEL
jgi:hypothetical protein